MKAIAGVPGGWLLENLMTKKECETVIFESEELGLAIRAFARIASQSKIL